MANTVGDKELKKSWPFETGLVSGTTSQLGRDPKLRPTEGSKIPRREKALIG